MKERTYRYFTGDVLYPFGFGLSYSTWAVNGAAKEGGTITAEIANTGSMDGETVVQVYVKCESPDAPVHPRLCGFARVSVPAGKTKTVAVTLDKLTDTVVNEQGERVFVNRMKFFVGLSQPDEKSVKLCGVKPVTVEN